MPSRPTPDAAPAAAEPTPPHTAASLDREAALYVARARMMVARARTLVLADRQDAIDLLANRRRNLGEHFTRYQVFKHANIFDPIVEHGPASSKVVARSMKMDCLELGETYRAYLDRWLGLTPREWASYRRDMLAVAEVLATHLDVELCSMRQLLMISRFYRRDV